MKRYGYHRTSTREQHLDRGIKGDYSLLWAEQSGTRKDIYWPADWKEF